MLAAVERLLELVVELGGTASYLSQAEMVLPPEHAWVKQAEAARKALQAKLSLDRTAEHADERVVVGGKLEVVEDDIGQAAIGGRVGHAKRRLHSRVSKL